MTDKEIEKLANKVADIIFKRQEEYDAQFEIDMHRIAEQNSVFYYTTSTTRDVLLELESKLKYCIDKEDYKEAARLTKEIKKLKDEKS